MVSGESEQQESGVTEQVYLSLVRSKCGAFKDTLGMDEGYTLVNFNC